MATVECSPPPPAPGRGALHMPNTPDPGHRYHFHSLLRDLAGGTRLPDGGLPDGTSCKEQGQPSPSGTAPPGGLHSDGRALNYSHRGQF